MTDYETLGWYLAGAGAVCLAYDEATDKAREIARQEAEYAVEMHEMSHTDHGGHE